MVAYVDLARAVLAGIRMQASNRMKVQCFDDVGRQERALRSQCSAHYGLQEVVLPIDIGDFQPLVDWVLLVFSTKLEQDQRFAP